MKASTVAKAPKLTAKQEAFCLSYIESGNASDAYRKSYSAKAMNPNSVHQRAKELMRNSKITARIAELRAPAVAKAQITFESHLARLEAISQRAQELEQMSAACAAEVARGKAAGLYVDKVEHTGAVPIIVNVTAVQINQVVEALRGEF